MPQLDGLRAIAVGLVLVHHLLNPDLLPRVLSEVSWGFVGVRMFFVLSGFLITGILVRARMDADRHGTNPFWVIRQFYARRFLRIFPLYYFVILVGAIVNLHPIREEFWWLASYLFNVRVALLGWFPENVAHFWSLAVEEQFYVFWPWVVLFAPMQSLLRLSLVMTALGPVWRAVAPGDALYGRAISVLTPSCIDSLGLGAVLAVVSRGEPVTREVVQKLSRVALPTGLFLVIALEVCHGLGIWRYSGYVYIVLYDSAVSLFFCWLVAVASRGSSGIVGRLLTFGPVAYCGRIAYGIYVYHLLLSEPVYKIGIKAGLTWDWKGYGYFIVASLVSFGIAAISWHLMESPLNNLKSHFPYAQASRSQ